MSIADTFDNLATNYSEAENAFKTKLKELQESFRPKMTEAFQEVFNSIPELGAIRWTQYTPHFNDGDECVFGVNEFEFVSKEAYEDEDADIEDVGYSEADLGYKPFRPEEEAWWTPEREALYQRVEAFKSEMQKVPEDIWRALFGDHVEVVVTRKGIEVDEYDHD